MDDLLNVSRTVTDWSFIVVLKFNKDSGITDQRMPKSGGRPLPRSIHEAYPPTLSLARVLEGLPAVKTVVVRADLWLDELTCALLLKSVPLESSDCTVALLPSPPLFHAGGLL